MLAKSKVTFVAWSWITCVGGRTEHITPSKRNLIADLDGPGELTASVYRFGWENSSGIATVAAIAERVIPDCD